VFVGPGRAGSRPGVPPRARRLAHSVGDRRRPRRPLGRSAAALALRRAREDGHAIGFATGDPWRDALLADLGVALGALLDDLTARQAEIASLILVDGARQVDVAVSLGVSRATVSVAVARGRLHAIAGVRHAIEELLAGPPPAGSRRVPAGASPSGV